VPDAGSSRFQWAFVFAAAALFQLPFFDRTMSVMDEGHILMFADIIANGGELYRDATLLPLPGAFYLLALAFKLFEPSILVARWIVLIEFAALCTFAFATLRRLTSLPAAWAGVLALFGYRIWAFPHWYMYSYSTLSLCLLAAALVCMLRFLEREDLRWLGAAGLVSGLAVLCKQDYGVAGLVAMIAVLLVKRIAERAEPHAGVPTLLGWYLGPAAAVGAVMALHFLRQGLFGEMLQQTLLNHLIGIANFEYSSLPPLLPLFEQSEVIRSPYGFGAYTPAIMIQADWTRFTATAFYRETILWDLAVKLFFYGPYLYVAFASVRLWRMREALRDSMRRLGFLQEFALTALAALLLLALSKPVDYVHVAVLYWPLLCLFVVHVHAWIGGRPRRAWTFLGLAALPAVAVAGYSASLLSSLIEMNDTPLRGDRAGVFVLPNDDRVIGEAVDYVLANSSADQAVAVLPYYPLVSFLADRRSPHRATYTLWPIEYIPDRERQIIEAMEARDTRFLIYHFTQFAQFPRMEDYAPELFRYLVEVYEIDRVISDPGWGMMLAGLKRSDRAAAGQPVLAEDLSNAAVAIERADGGRQTLTAEQRPEIVTAALWPFRPVVAQRPLTGGRRSVMTVSVDVPPASRLQTAMGVHPKRWFKHPPAKLTFEIWAVAGGERELLATRTINPQGNHLDRHWFEIDVPLDAWAGRQIDLEFTLATNREHAETLDMSGWATPRLVTPVAASP